MEVEVWKMMIFESKFMEQCDGCPYLEPCADATNYVNTDLSARRAIITSCKNYEKCLGISKHIREQIKRSTDILKMKAVTGAFDDIIKNESPLTHQARDVGILEPWWLPPIDLTYLSDGARNIAVQAQKEINDSEKRERANWKVWTGWKRNHNKRIEACCSKCGYHHPTVKGSLTKLSPTCPSCGCSMGVIFKDVIV